MTSSSANPKPKVVGIWGPTKAGKTTLSYNIAYKLCSADKDDLLPVLAPGKKDKVHRFINQEAEDGSPLHAYCVSIIGQDSFYSKNNVADKDWDRIKPSIMSV